jgi:hypothetical protein
MGKPHALFPGKSFHTFRGTALVRSRPADGAASMVKHNAKANGGGAPLPIFFTGIAVNGDVQALIEDPRLDQTALCRAWRRLSPSVSLRRQ